MKVQLHKAHPWHGISIGENCPEIITSFIEMVPADLVKYEIDKASGYRKVDRPQKFSNIIPALYGFVPQIRKFFCWFHSCSVGGGLHGQSMSGFHLQ